MVKNELVNINVKVPRTFKELIQKYVKCNLYTNLSEFTRDALREKIQRDAPELYKELLKEANKNDS